MVKASAGGGGKGKKSKNSKYHLRYYYDIMIQKVCVLHGMIWKLCKYCYCAIKNFYLLLVSKINLTFIEMDFAYQKLKQPLVLAMIECWSRNS